MPALIVIVSFFWNSANTILMDAKFITSVLAAAIATMAAMLRNLTEISEDRSKRATEKVETARIAALVDLLGKLPAGDSFSSCKKELELQLAHSVSKLDAVRRKVLNLAQSPNGDLTLLQRMFVLFPPNSRLAWIIHGLAYLFMAVGPLAVLMLIFFRLGDAGAIGDIVVLVVFGSLAFRAWALAERKWTLQSEKSASEPVQKETNPLAILFVLRKSTSWKMLAAQVCMWACIFCATESLEDILLAGMDASRAATHTEQAQAALDKAQRANPPGQEARSDLLGAEAESKTAADEAKGGVILFLTALLGAGICSAWASSELCHLPTLPDIRFVKAIFPVSKPATLKSSLLAGSYLIAMALLIVSLVSWSRIFGDPIDRIEFSFIWVAVCVALNRLLNRCAYAANHSIETRSADWSQSAAA